MVKTIKIAKLDNQASVYAYKNKLYGISFYFVSYSRLDS